MRSRYPSLPDRRRVDRCVILTRDDTSCTVSIDLDVRMPLGLRVHRGERDAAIRMLMARSTGIFIKTSRNCVFGPDSRAAAETLVDAIRDRLFRIACKPVSQRQVEGVLDMTSRERIRGARTAACPDQGRAGSERAQPRYRCGPILAMRSSGWPPTRPRCGGGVKRMRQQLQLAWLLFSSRGLREGTG